MTYLVTGAAGFIGSYVVRQLVEEGERVVAVDRQFPGALDRVLGDGDDAVTRVTGEVDDLALLIDLVREHRADRIIHLAAELHWRSAANPGQCIRSNVVGTHNVLEVARLCGVEKLVTASSAAIFGPSTLHDGPIANDARLRAQDVYEASKIFGESEGEYYGRRFSVDNAAIRVGLAYGFACLVGNGKRMVDELLMKPLSGEPGRVPWGDSSINWTYVVDAAAAFVAASRVAAKDTFAYNLRGDYRPIADAVECARKLLPDADIEAEPGSHTWAQEFDDSVLRTEVGFRSQWSLEDGLADTLERARAELASR